MWQVYANVPPFFLVPDLLFVILSSIQLTHRAVRALPPIDVSSPLLSIGVSAGSKAMRNN